MGFRWSVRVFRIWEGKTRQPTRWLQVLEAETRRRPSPASGRPVLGPDWTVFAGGSGPDFLWTTLIITWDNVKHERVWLARVYHSTPEFIMGVANS